MPSFPTAYPCSGCSLEKGRQLTKEQQDRRDYYTERIEALRDEWARLRIRSDEAARERMIALGHINPGDAY